MVRTTASEVKAIIDTDKTDSEVESYIDTANAIVTERLGGATSNDTLLAEVEKYLAAHFMSVSEPRLSSGSVGDESFSYDIGGAMDGIASTRYGRAAVSIDPTGLLDSENHDAEFFSVN